MRLRESSTYELVEELSLIFQFSVFVDSDRRVRRLRGNELEEGVDADALHELAMALKSLSLLILALLDAPEDGGAVKTAGNEELRVAAPA